MEEKEIPGLGNNQDMVDRKAAWVERMFDKLFAAIEKDPKAALLVLSVVLNFWMFSIITDLNKLRIADITLLNEKINIAVERSVKNELPKQLAPYKEQQDSNSKKLDSSLINLDGTVEKVKQYYKKNK
ncbi:hypothetical protein [Pedobacter sp. L105]|uniref:hypothetical protein n=1 Tax=Pedobacter sp. L105 TaxID=1641871 RepID=UPI00131BF194|nr:hypothetical protein [Pedobacter sp. L105]